MKLTQQLLALLALFAVGGGVAFAPVTTPSRLATPTSSTVARMGLFDGVFDGIKEYFSEEAQAEREAEKQRILDEQEEAYREVLARRRNPEAMSEYMEERKERLKKFPPKDQEE